MRFLFENSGAVKFCPQFLHRAITLYGLWQCDLFPEYLENFFFLNDRIIEEELMTDIQVLI